MMKKLGWIILGVVVLLFLLVAGRYNTMVSLDESVKTARANVETQYQRRADLIPGLVEIAESFAIQEREVLMGVTEARAEATRTNVNINDASDIAAFQSSQAGLSSALSRLLAVVENYPDLKSNQNFLELQSQYEGTENRISVARTRYNEAVRVYNTYIRRFPANIAAAIFGFDKAYLFEASEGSEEAPEIEFDFE